MKTKQVHMRIEPAEEAQLKAIGVSLGASSHAVARMFVRDGLRQHDGRHEVLKNGIEELRIENQKMRASVDQAVLMATSALALLSMFDLPWVKGVTREEVTKRTKDTLRSGIALGEQIAIIRANGEQI